jgi:hypothetical protein
VTSPTMIGGHSMNTGLLADVMRTAEAAIAVSSRPPLSAQRARGTSTGRSGPPDGSASLADSNTVAAGGGQSAAR